MDGIFAQDHILGQDEIRTLRVHLLYVKDNLDEDALNRPDQDRTIMT